jgi:hypothetical protein
MKFTRGDKKMVEGILREHIAEVHDGMSCEFGMKEYRATGVGATATWTFYPPRPRTADGRYVRAVASMRYDPEDGNSRTFLWNGRVWIKTYIIGTDEQVGEGQEIRLAV